MSSAAKLLDGLGRPAYLHLGNRFASSRARAYLPTGNALLDKFLRGGLPCGQITEVFGQRSAGCAALVTQVAASATCRGETIGWIDPLDQLEPESLLACGGQLTGVLWLRPHSFDDTLRAADLLLRTGGFGLVVMHLGEHAGRVGAGRWRRLQQAIEQARTVCLLCSTRRVGDSSAALVLEMHAPHARWRIGAGRQRLLDGLDVQLSVVRNRFGRVGDEIRLPWQIAA